MVDPFSQILGVANATSAITGGWSAGAPWALRFPKPDKLKYFAIAKGTAWLTLGRKNPIALATGDVFSLSTAQPSFIIASDPAVAPRDTHTIFTPGANAIVALDPRTETHLVLGGHVKLDAGDGGILAEVLPPLIHLRAASPQAEVVRWLLSRLIRERVAKLPGTSLASSQLAQLMFIELMRVHLAETTELAPGLLRAIGDPRLAPALRLMHDRPDRAWQLGELAKAAGMSRSTFALHFKETAGVPPLAYLTRWRIRLAEKALRDDNTAISELSRSLGYASESAFSTAFKRETGLAPSHYRAKASAPTETASAPRPRHPRASRPRRMRA